MEHEAPQSRYVVGFDLGTTNCAVAFVDTEDEQWSVQTLKIPQLTAPAQVERLETLPSFHYEPARGEFSPEMLRIPCYDESPDYIVGVLARDHGGRIPGRMIGSAKSWLCHAGVDRTAPLLPWHGAEDVERLSPVDVASRYLGHVRAVWDSEHPEHPLAEQDFVLTLPASFDEVARELTIKAAAAADLKRVVLIEEPQAAFYAWIDRHRDDWADLVRPGMKILVCDIGGGTSDFTLIRVRSDSDGKVRFHRIAVGEHLILGGDNLDLTLAQYLEKKLTDGKRLEPAQWTGLLKNARALKETMLAAESPDEWTINVASGGSRLLGGGLQLTVTREEVRDILLEGFLPNVSLDAQPNRAASGFREFGLPYAADAAITRYLASFLSAHRHLALEDVELADDVDPARPDIVLFNGGFFASDLLRERLLDVVSGWFTDSSDPEESWRPVILDNERLDLAVARGAAYYGMVRRGQGERINAALARTYYVGVEAEMQQEGEQNVSALCLLPAGTESGDSLVLDSRRFNLMVGRPVEFPLYSSSTRLTDEPGDLVPLDRESLTPLPPIRTVLRTKRKQDADQRTAVQLEAGLNEIGTLDLWCREAEGRGRWRLQFDVRSTVQSDLAAHDAVAEQQGFVDESLWETLEGVLDSTFGLEGNEKASSLLKRMSLAAEIGRGSWPPSLLRRIADWLIEHDDGRRKSESHEARWLNLLGYALRPGYGLAMDDFRVASTWNALRGKLRFASSMSRAESWILWRRVAGGLEAGRQAELAGPVLRSIRAMHRQLTTGLGKGSDLNAGSHEMAEIWRLFGSLERLAPSVKIELGDILLDLLPRKKMETVRPALLWTLGRLGARSPVYGPLNAIVPTSRAEGWIARLLKLDHDDDLQASFALMELSRKTDDRYRDVSEKVRKRVLRGLDEWNAPTHYATLVEKVGILSDEEETTLFGEALPIGLRLE
jgi:molecular chaperone DnaK (HSP70)